MSRGLVISRSLVSAMPFVMVKAAAEIAERRLVRRDPEQFRDLALAELADHLGEVDAVDRPIAHGEAALALQRGHDLVRVGPAARDLERELGAAFEHAELRGVREQRLGLHAIERRSPVKSGTGFDASSTNLPVACPS